MTPEEAEVILKVNDKEARDKFDSLSNKLQGLRKEFAEAFKKGDTKEVSRITKEINKTTKEMSNMRTNIGNIRAAMQRLDKATPKELHKTIRLINNELNSGRVERGSKEWDQLIKKLKEAQREAERVRREMSIQPETNWITKVRNLFNGWGASIAGASVAFAGLTMAGKDAVQAYADMEAEEANVRKFTGMTAEQVAELNEELKKMDTRTSREGLNQLAQEAGRLGKTSVEDVLGFVKAADQINVALDDLGEGATLTLSKLTGIFGDEKTYGTEQSLLKVGSVINELSQNCSASAPYLAEFSSRLGGIAAQSKMSISQVMAFAAVLDTQNLNVEASSTAVGQLITKIYQEPQEIAKAVALDVTKFSSLVKTDMNGALVMLFEQLNRFGGMESLASVFDAMGTDGARAIPVLSALAGHVEELKSQQDVANQAFREGISVTNEFNVQNNTVQAGLDKAKKGFKEMSVQLGQQLLPVMNACISGTSLMMNVISGLFTFVGNHIGAITSLTLGIAGYTVAVNASIIADKLKVFWQEKVLVSLNKLSAALLKNPWGIAAAGVSLLIGVLVDLARKTSAQAEAEKTLADVRKYGTQQAAEQISKLEALVAAAQDETISLDKRKVAINELNRIVPGYNASLDETSGKYIANKAALDNYINSLIRLYEVEGAKAKIGELTKERIDARIELQERTRKYNEVKELNDRGGGHTYTTSWGSVGNTSQDLTEHYLKLVLEAQAKVDRTDAKLKLLDEVYGEDIKENAVKNAAEGERTPLAAPESEKKLKEAQREADKAERKANKAKTEALKKDLEERKILYTQEEAENLALYVTGVQNYEDYVKQREELEEKYVDDLIEIHEGHNKLDMSGYASTLQKKADLKKKAADKEHQEDEKRAKEKLALDLKELEGEHKSNTAGINLDYYDPSSAAFNNQKALNQSLLEEDLRYLNEKKKLYAEGSEERAQIENQISERIAQDQLDKQKETAERIKEIQAKYDSAAKENKYKMELDALNELHNKKLISEEAFQKALKELRQRHRSEEREETQARTNEFSQMTLDINDAFEDLFESIRNGGQGLGDALVGVANVTYAAMSATLQQYSAYTNAERDLELAKIEKRYDKEIKAAGKNEKKKKKLEEQKEAEVAKVKKKYNDRAMKIEIAQAVAATALAAINAYASASKANWVLGPIAAALAVAAGAVQIATIKKQHEAQAEGYYEGGFTSRDPSNRREVGVVHANEFVANHDAVANPALSPVLRLIDNAQRNNTVGSLTAADVSNAIGQGQGVSARGEAASSGAAQVIAGTVAMMTASNASSNEVIGRLSSTLEEGITAYVVMDGEQGMYRKFKRYEKLTNNPRR